MNASTGNELSTKPRRRKSRLRRGVAAAVAVGAVALSLTFLQTAPASAHCDSRQGPVATAAQQALESGDVKLVLPYVQAEQEEELTAAFDQTMAIRKRGADVQAVADEYFLETAVRLHRVGEGASYTGLKDEVEMNPALEAAESSLEKGSPDEVVALLEKDLDTSVSEQFGAVMEAREAEKANPTVAVSRERAEAELAFENYVLEISTLINRDLAHEDPAADQPAAGH